MVASPPDLQTVARQCYYDNFGVLRRGVDARNRGDELRLILEAEMTEATAARIFADRPAEAFDAGAAKSKKKGEDDATGALAEEWRVINASWLHRWLAFAHYNRQRSAPGPVRNEDLLYWEDDAGAWKGKPALVAPGPATTAAARGHYR
mmetsp:Transcript_20175/g.80534  ORF Transcript_20175/g.80534 Transcript_20175/m.80534 type:complete len:149 (+) Transcript_20175:42-488(+)